MCVPHGWECWFIVSCGNQIGRGELKRPRRSGGWQPTCWGSKARDIKIHLNITLRRLRVLWLANLHNNFAAKAMTQCSMSGRVINFGPWPWNICAKLTWTAALTWLPKDIKCGWTMWSGMSLWRSKIVLECLDFSNFVRGPFHRLGKNIVCLSILYYYDISFFFLEYKELLALLPFPISCSLNPHANPHSSIDHTSQRYGDTKKNHVINKIVTMIMLYGHHIICDIMWQLEAASRPFLHP